MQILVTELGDETFIIAAIMAMRHSRLTVHAGAMSALALMTVSHRKAQALLGISSCIACLAHDNAVELSGHTSFNCCFLWVLPRLNQL